MHKATTAKKKKNSRDELISSCRTDNTACSTEKFEENVVVPVATVGEPPVACLVPACLLVMIEQGSSTTITIAYSTLLE